MRYLVIIDNGKDYSDHRHMPVAVCATEVEAQNLADKLTVELADTIAARGDDGYLYDHVLMADDMPLARSLSLLAPGVHWQWNGTTYDVIPIPEWADLTI